MKKFTHDATDKIWNFSKPVIVSLRTSKEFSSCISTTIYAKLTSAQYQPVNRPPVFKENIKKNFSIRYILLPWCRKIYIWKTEEENFHNAFRTRRMSKWNWRKMREKLLWKATYWADDDWAWQRFFTMFFF